MYVTQIENWLNTQIVKYDDCKKLLKIIQHHEFLTEELREYNGNGMFINREHDYNRLVAREYVAYAKAYNRVLGRSI